MKKIVFTISPFAFANDLAISKITETEKLAATCIFLGIFTMFFDLILKDFIIHSTEWFFYSDKRETQRIGIIPDIEIKT